MTARFTIFFTVSILLFAAGAQAEEHKMHLDDLAVPISDMTVVDQGRGNFF
jgi:hypothetical protein